MSRALEKMEIAFKTKALRTVCLSREAMDAKYGAEAGAILRGRLSDMRAAERLGDIPLLSMSSVAGANGARLRINLGETLHMVVRSNHRTSPVMDSGEIDWSEVDRVIVDLVECSNV